MALTDTTIRSTKAGDKSKKLADEKGLYLLVNQAGRYWRMDYRYEDKRKTLALGVYPDTTLKLARNKRDEARKLLAEGIDPGAARKRAKLERRKANAETFEVVAREWMKIKAVHGFPTVEISG